MAEEQKNDIERELEILQRVTPGTSTASVSSQGYRPSARCRGGGRSRCRRPVQVLKEQNSLVRQYEKLFKFEKVKLTFTDRPSRPWRRPRS